MQYRIARLDGDGIGPEIMAAAAAVVDAASQRTNAQIEWVPLPMGRAGFAVADGPMPLTTVEALKCCHGTLMGPHDSASYPAEWHRKRAMPPAGVLRIGLDLYLNIRPAKSLSNVGREGLDLVIVRENTEGLYSDRNMHVGNGEFMPSADVALTVGVYTRRAIERAAVSACELAMTRRKKVSVAHKANVMPVTNGFFRDICFEVAKRYEGLVIDDYHADAMCALLVRDPGRFDVILAENMLGDIISDLASELAGGLGLGPSLNAGADHLMAQPVHGGAPDIEGKGIANPVGMILSAAMLFDALSRRHSDPTAAHISSLIRTSVSSTLDSGDRTGDLGGRLGSAQFTEAVIRRMA